MKEFSFLQRKGEEGRLVGLMTDLKLYEKADVKKLPNSEVEISVTVTADTILSYREKALSHLKKESSLPGFRKGKVPEKIIIEKVGEMGILDETAELLIKDVYPKVVADSALDVLGQPQIQVTKIAPGNPLEFTIRVALFPSFELPDYKNIAGGILKKS